MSDDTILLARFAGTRDAEAFAELVRRHAGLVHGTCRRICGVRAQSSAGRMRPAS